MIVIKFTTKTKNDSLSHISFVNCEILRFTNLLLRVIKVLEATIFQR